MAAIDVILNQSEYRAAEQMLAHIPGGLRRAIVGAINDTGREEVTQVSKAIRERVNIKKRDIDPHLKFRKANASVMQGRLTISESARLSLKYFGARQTRAGITYRIAKSGGRTAIKSAFIVEKLGGHAFRRKGPKRLPIIKLFGPSPWGVFVKAGLMGPTVEDTRRRLSANLRDRVRFLNLKAVGVI